MAHWKNNQAPKIVGALNKLKWRLPDHIVKTPNSSVVRLIQRTGSWVWVLSIKDL